MRLDFNSFIITGPSTDTLSIGKAIYGQIDANGKMELNPATSCATDVFTITNAPNLPELCGTLSGEHGNKCYIFFISILLKKCMGCGPPID